ncbi:peptide chain release factor N(5)-glutamine methyltransferase [Nitrosophilus alvini]|uniref:peptide chain release factor N(5)-glutamine methyltransferase n=1 Tax=Nitrosophilus alvini TaxID=2714855 RepID=UPI00190DA9D0|nr:peptide chain release factor N(5)-glutamine methyltransferase [Nitrosophilus alvini]
MCKKISIKEAIKTASKMLKDAAQRPRFEAELLLSHLLEKERIWLHIHDDKTLDENEFQEYINLIKRRAAHEPVEYITGKVSFYKETFFIQRGVLIPRPETELLIDEVIKNLDAQKETRIAEIGVGSGVISIMLAKKLKNIKITATDISKEAIQTAELNIKLHKVEERIELIECSMLDSVDENIDVIVSNPPYIAKDYKLPKSLRYEPETALFGGQKGDELLGKIIDLAFERNIKMLACEMGYDQKSSIEKKLCGKKYLSLCFYKDLAGFDRGFVLKIR